jgi:uncharacterized damage-inducible protein DinB
MNKQLQEQIEEMKSVRQHAFSKLAQLPDSALLEADAETKRSVRQMISLYFGHERNHIVQIEKTRRIIAAHPTEVELLLAQGDQSRGDLLAALEGLSDEEWTRKPAENVWSIQEILAHLMDVENRLLQRILALVGPPNS